MLLKMGRILKRTCKTTEDADEIEHDLNTSTPIVYRDMLAKIAVFDANIATNRTMKQVWTRDRLVDPFSRTIRYALCRTNCKRGCGYALNIIWFSVLCLKLSCMSSSDIIQTCVNMIEAELQDRH